MQQVKRVFHPYTLWEDHKEGFYNTCSGNEKEYKISKVKEMFNNKELTNKFMLKVINEWTYSCEHNLSNLSMNRVAYLGQAACCLYAKVPNLVTMYAWKFLDREVREVSDKIAVINILKWEQKQRLKNTYKIGREKGTSTEYQMKLLLSQRKEGQYPVIK